MKKIQCIVLLLAVLMLSGCGEANARKKEIAKGLADGNYHVLVPENEAASHADGVFEDYDTYCVFRLPDEKTVFIDSDRPEAKGYDGYDMLTFPRDNGMAFLDRWRYELDGEIYYLDVYRSYTEKANGERSYAGDTLIAGKALPGWKEGWMLAGYAEDEIPAMITDSLIDLNTAPSEALGDYTVYSFEGIDINDLAAYGNYLLRSGEWNYCTDVYDNPTSTYYGWYIEEFENISTEHHRLVLAYQDRVKVITGGGRIDMDEEELWAMVDAPAKPGEHYLRRNCPSFPLRTDTGSGYGADLAYSWNESASAADFESMRAKLLERGFTENVEEYEKNGQQIFTAWRRSSYCGFEFRLYTKLIMEGTYLEVQVGKTNDEGRHYPT